MFRGPPPNSQLYTLRSQLPRLRFPLLGSLLADADWRLAFMRPASCLFCVNTETLAIRISKSERTAIRKRAKQEKLSQGDLVRRALRAYGVTAEPAKAKTGYDVIKHLIGSCKGGPTDLATNPKHMEGFGR